MTKCLLGNLQLFMILQWASSALTLYTFRFQMLGEFRRFLGSQRLRELLEADIIRFIHLQYEPAVTSLPGDVMGDVGLVTLFNSTNQSANVSILIRRQFAPAPHEEADAEMLFVQIEKQTTIFDNGGELELANLVRSSIMRPDVARLLGIGEAILPAQVPSWLTFPYLRMAHLVHTGAVCDRFGLQAAKVPFGGAKLISAAFGVQASIDSADQYAGYVMAGRFNANLGTVLFSQPNVIEKIIQFRNTTEGEVFRKEIRSQLLANEASAFMASVNAGLIKSIPAPILDNARDRSEERRVGK